MNAYCNHHGIGIIPWSPLAGGALARPFGELTARTEATKGSPYEKTLSEADKVIIGRTEEIAKKRGWTMGQVALAWVQSKVSSPIVGVSSVRAGVSLPVSLDGHLHIGSQPERLEQAIITGKLLTDEEVKYLEEP